MLEDDADLTDESLDPDEMPQAHAEPAPIEKFRRSAVGSVFAAGLLGLRDVIEPPKDEEPAIVVDWSGAPPDDKFVMRFDPDNPEDSIVMVRVPKPGITPEGTG